MTATYQFLVPTGFRAVKISRKVQNQINERVAQGRCTSCGGLLVDGEKVVRGCHESCATALRRAAKEDRQLSREEMDAKFVREGRWLPPGKPGRKPTNPTAIALAEEGC